MNLSLGGTYSSSLNAKVTELVSAGIPVVVSSGNDGQDSCSVSPASAPAAITVNASTSDDSDASFSNWGSCTDLYAPGVDIISAWNTSDSATKAISGTSMAAPHVTGVVARLLADGASGNDDFDAILAAENPGVVRTGLLGDPTSLLFIASTGGPASFGSTSTTIDGVAVVGETLTASVAGWTPTPATLSYQWLLNGKPIKGATGSTYVVGSRDAKKRIAVRVTGSRATYLPATVTSVPTAAVLRGFSFSATQTPTVDGFAVVGQTLTASVADWTPVTTSLSYQWLLNGKPIKGATGSTYVVGSRDAKKRIAVRVTGSKTSFLATTVTSAPTPVSPGA